MAITPIKKHAVRIIHAGKSRSYILYALDTIDAICSALDLLEDDVPCITACMGLAIISKPFPEGAHLADEGEGPVIDMTRLRVVPDAATEDLAAA
jgi:hypothetical protein